MDWLVRIWNLRPLEPHVSDTKVFIDKLTDLPDESWLKNTKLHFDKHMY